MLEWIARTCYAHVGKWKKFLINVFWSNLHFFKIKKWELMLSGETEHLKGNEILKNCERYIKNDRSKWMGA